MAYSMSEVFCTEVTQVISVFELTHLPEARDKLKWIFGQVKIMKEFV
jgi:hypothetical protein